jgi:hypothetical protein
MTLTIEIERESDGRWIAEVPTLPGTMCYGQTRDEAIAHVQAWYEATGIGVFFFTGSHNGDLYLECRLRGFAGAKEGLRGSSCPLPS